MFSGAIAYSNTPPSSTIPDSWEPSVLCNTIPGETYSNVYLLQKGNWWMTEYGYLQGPTWWAYEVHSLLGLLTGAEWLKDSCITQAHSNMGDSSWQLETWSWVHNRLETVSGYPGWPELLSGSFDDLLASQPVTVSSRELSWCIQVSHSSLLKLLYV